MDEYFCQQARRFSAAILMDCKEKQRRMRAKRPPRRYAMVMKATSKIGEWNGGTESPQRELQASLCSESEELRLGLTNLAVTTGYHLSLIHISEPTRH